MTKQPYPEEFKIEAIKQITQRGHRVADVSARIGVSQHSRTSGSRPIRCPRQRDRCRRPRPRSCGG